MTSIPPNHNCPNLPSQEYEHPQANRVLAPPLTNTPNNQHAPQSITQTCAGTPISSDNSYDQRFGDFIPQNFTPHNQHGPRILSNGQIYNPHSPSTSATDPPPQEYTFNHPSQPSPSALFQSPRSNTFNNSNHDVGDSQQPPWNHSFYHANQSAMRASNQHPVQATDPASSRSHSNPSDNDDKDKKEGHSWHDMLKNTAEILDDAKGVAEAFGGHGGHGNGHGHVSEHRTSPGHSYGSGKGQRETRSGGHGHGMD